MQLGTQLAEALANARRRTDELFSLLVPAALYDRPIPERHRNIFYLGHLEAFDWNQVCRNSLGMPSFHPEFDKLFEFGIDPPVGRLPEDQPRDWPSVEEIQRYNTRVRDEIDKALERGGAPETVWRVAIEHRLMHAETFAYMLHNLPPGRKIAPAGATLETAGPSTSRRMLEVAAGAATLGRERGNGFGWDNEFDAHTVGVPAFAMNVHKVSNGEYLQLVREGADVPPFWFRRDDVWYTRTMFGSTPLPLDWPAYVSHDEASAYARWAGKELPSEAEWHRAACGTRSGGERAYPWGADSPDAVRHGNFDFERWDPVAVGSFPEGNSEFGVTDLVGNGWEWTRTPFGPFPGFQAFSFYPGYSANFFDGKHFVMKGGSPRTAACMLRRSFRNWFQPHYPYVYAAFRCVEH